ncbi:hypothetical protein AVEN_73956-1 [Araneus ventricosus]|uniref:Uncharacterized protein n=1 Tax=Araneus ventricosus TaxID=182803 RepID=A0A4Y2QUY6_ARAVE|nr:hypothetical protein AVEN_73956-1 [Araneus ventricosus]
MISLTIIAFLALGTATIHAVPVPNPAFANAFAGPLGNSPFIVGPHNDGEMAQNSFADVLNFPQTFVKHAFGGNPFGNFGPNVGNPNQDFLNFPRKYPNTDQFIIMFKMINHI